MKNSPKNLLLLSSLIVTSASIYALPEQASDIAGIRNNADFDWSQTNMINNPGYFNNSSNFFEGKDINFDSNTHGFLNSKKMSVNNDKKGKTRRAVSSMGNAGAKGYNNFGDSVSYDLNSSDTVTGMGADTGNGIEKFEIFGGSTGRNMNVTMQFRGKSDAEKYGSHDRHGHHSDNTIIGHSPLVSNVMRLHGMGIQAASADGRVKTDPFALEATYTQEDFDATYSLTELQELINGCLFLGWLNTAIDGDHTNITDTDRWVHAVQGNFDNMPDNPNRHDEHGVIGNAVVGTLQDYINGTQTSVAGLSKLAGEIRVGDHGGDADSNTVWAIVDHNSDFAVIPEPSTYALIGGIICLISVALRRRK